jgi:hypothetical protein
VQVQPGQERLRAGERRRGRILSGGGGE